MFELVAFIEGLDVVKSLWIVGLEFFLLETEGRWGVRVWIRFIVMVLREMLSSGESYAMKETVDVEIIWEFSENTASDFYRLMLERLSSVVSIWIISANASETAASLWKNLHVQ